MPLPNNLDFFVAQAAMEFASGDKTKKDEIDKIENAVQKAISILSSQGLFAMFLWSYAGKAKKYDTVAKEILKSFKKINLVESSLDPNSAQAILEAIKNELNAKKNDSLSEIRFLEDLTMRILIYARHYLKSLG